ncbi:MAG: efflux RND transporter periplasmic adaptor subunit [Sulfurovum sp.]
MIKKIQIVILILIIPLLLNAQKAEIIKQLFSIKTVVIDSMSGSKKHTNYGYIKADESRIVDIYARFSGFVTLLYADNIYKEVKKGEALAQIYSPEVYRAKEDYVHSLAFDSRQKSSQMVYSAKRKLALLGVSLQEIKKLTKSRKASEFTTIYAPQSGFIFEKNINQGGSFDKRKKLFQIINLEKVWIEAKIFQNELEYIDRLEIFDISVAGVKHNYRATKSILYPYIKPKETTATLRLLVDNSDYKLKIGMYVKVLSSTQAKSSLVIPITATIRKDKKWYAFLATAFEGEYEPIEIEIEPLDNRYYRVIKGLQKGDTVVNNALFMMDSDAQINGIY